jgi:hypothetical protein
MTGFHPTLPLNGVVPNAWFRADSGRSRAPYRNAGVDERQHFWAPAANFFKLMAK